MIVRPQKCVGIGTGVKRLKFGATVCPLRTVMSFASQSGRSWPSKGLPPPAWKAGSVTRTVWSAPAQAEMMPGPCDGGCVGGSGSLPVPGPSEAASVDVGGKFSWGR